MDEQNLMMFYDETGGKEPVNSLVWWNSPDGTVYREDGEWKPLEQNDFEDLDGLAADRMGQDVISFLDEADQSGTELYRPDVEQFIVPAT